MRLSVPGVLSEHELRDLAERVTAAFSVLAAEASKLGAALVELGPTLDRQRAVAEGNAPARRPAPFWRQQARQCRGRPSAVRERTRPLSRPRRGHNRPRG